MSTDRVDKRRQVPCAWCSGIGTTGRGGRGSGTCGVCDGKKTIPGFTDDGTRAEVLCPDCWRESGTDGPPSGKCSACRGTGEVDATTAAAQAAKKSDEGILRDNIGARTRGAPVDVRSVSVALADAAKRASDLRTLQSNIAHAMTRIDRLEEKVASRAEPPEPASVDPEAARRADVDRLLALNASTQRSRGRVK